MPLPQQPTSVLPAPEPGGAVYFSGWAETPEAREKALRVAERLRQQREIEAERAKYRPQPERMTDVEAGELLRDGERQLAELHTLFAQMTDRVEAQRAKVRADEVAIDTTQSVWRTAMETFVANPMARKPEDITGTISELRAKYEIRHEQLRAMERDLSMMSGTYKTAVDAARKLIDRAHHHLVLNAADRFADQYEAAMRDAILADAALRGLIDRAILEKDHVMVSYLNRAREGTRVRTPDEMMRHRSALLREADSVREKFHHRSAIYGGDDD